VWTSAKGDAMYNSPANPLLYYRDDPPWTERDARVPCQDTSDRRRLFFVLTLGKMAASAMSEKAPASWEAGDILQTRPAGLVV